jgi:hypothetical protein
MMKVTTFDDDDDFGTDLYILMMKATSFDDKNNSLIVIYTIY